MGSGTLLRTEVLGPPVERPAGVLREEHSDEQSEASHVFAGEWTAHRPPRLCTPPASQASHEAWAPDCWSL